MEDRSSRPAILAYGCEPTNRGSLAFLEAAPNLVRRALLGHPTRPYAGSAGATPPGPRAPHLPHPADAWALAPLLALWSGTSMQVLPAVRFFTRSSLLIGADVGHGNVFATITAVFSIVAAWGAHSYAPSTISTYYFNTIRFAILFLKPPGDRFDSLIRKLLSTRIQRWTGPTNDTRAVFHRQHVLKALADEPTLELAAAIAFCWDTLSRVGSLISIPSPLAPKPMPAQNLIVTTSEEGHISVVLSTFEKSSHSWVKLRTSSNPASPFYNPANVGSARLMKALHHSRGHTGNLWNNTSAPRALCAQHMVERLVASNPALKDIRITPHSFRISGVSYLVFNKLATIDEVCHLGRWRDAKSLRSYVRENDQLRSQVARS